MRLLILISFILFMSCTDGEQKSEGKVVSSTACAKRTSDGAVVDCEPSKDALSNLDNLMAETKRIDGEYPGPGDPSLEKIYSVRSIDVDGTINIEKGVQLRFAGLECDHQDLIKYLKATFVGKSPSKLSYIETGYTQGKAIYAYIWEVNTNIGGDLEEGDIKFGPIVSNINETALTSSWCSPKKQDGHKYHERYLQLSKLAR
jgi:hypothetical protein